MDTNNSPGAQKYIHIYKHAHKNKIKINISSTKKQVLIYLEIQESHKKVFKSPRPMSKDKVRELMHLPGIRNNFTRYIPERLNGKQMTRTI